MEYISKMLKGKNLQPRILYPARLAFRIEEDKKNFSDKQKLKGSINTKPTLNVKGYSLSGKEKATTISKNLQDFSTNKGNIYRKGYGSTT